MPKLRKSERKQLRPRIAEALRSGEIKRLGGDRYLVPASLFLLGVTPLLVAEVDRQLKERG